MSVKYDVFAYLQAHAGEQVSGTHLAEQLGVTRNSVWKAINSLREDGYSIAAATNAGYCFHAGGDVLSPQSIARHVQTPGVTLQVHRQVDSTNLMGKALAVKGAPEGTVIVAESQTAGRGRLGRTFHSADKVGLYMSIVLRPNFPAAEALSITTIAAVAVAEGIEACSGKKTQIKWVNDVYLNEKKICGILTEASINFENGGLDYAVLGIGINVCAPEGGYPQELRSLVGPVFEETPPAEIRSKLAAAVIDRFFAHYHALPNKEYIKAYRHRSFLKGKRVVLSVGNTTEAGVVTDIDDEARLVLTLDSGEQKAFSAGEANILKKKDVMNETE